MSYFYPQLLTLLASVAMFASFLAAQDRELMREVDRLAAPTATERAEAIDRIANWEGDIAGDLRVAFKFAGNMERAGLFHAAVARADAALVQHAAVALSDSDARVSESARHYLLALPLDDVAVDTAELDTEQQDAWHSFVTFRLRRDIGRVLVEAYLKPGKFFGQFDELRRRDPGSLDRELLGLLHADEHFREPLLAAVQERLLHGIEPSRMFSAQWRLLTESEPALRSAVSFFHSGTVTDEISRELGRLSSSRFHAALSVVNDLRATAVRALGQSESQSSVAPLLIAAHRKASQFEPAPALRNAVNPEVIKTELEITLARFGLHELLNARIEALRLHAQKAQAAPANVNARTATRADLMAQNEIAQLLLRSGDAAGAEREWQSAIEGAIAQIRETNSRSRNALVSYVATAYYNLACAQDLQLKLSRSLESLKAAVEHGYRDYAWMLEDGDLAHLRRSPEFIAWFEDVAPPALVDRLHGAE